MTDEPAIRAAGGVVSRDDRICIVHRPEYDDWSLPKGKLSTGEHPLSAAVREVHEETGVRAAPLCPLPPVHYPVNGVPKIVEYWSMRVLSQDPFTPDDEVDEVRWLPVPEALDTLSYPHDAGVVHAFAALPPITSTVLLIRHASAGEPGTWPGPDTARPLDDAGVATAARLSPLLALFAPGRLVSASRRRCVQTLAPLAAALDRPIEVDSVFDEETDVRAAADRIRELAAAEASAAAGSSTVVCSQRQVIPELVGLLCGDGRAYPTAKGEGWVLPFRGDTLHAPGIYGLSVVSG